MSTESKTKDKPEETSWKYDGSEDGWDKFDRRMHRYARKKWGPEIGDQFWRGTLDDLGDLYGAEWNHYCEQVWEWCDGHEMLDKR